jgi:excisionase family DNA binding protein
MSPDPSDGRPILWAHSLQYSTSQAAQLLGVSPGTIRRWADAGELEHSRTPGGQRRFSHDQLERFASKGVAR